MRELQDTECFIIKQMDFKEKDKIITVLTQNQGKKAGILYQAKRMGSQHVASSELFNRVRLSYVENPHQELVKIRHCELIDSYYELRQSYERYLYANYFVELINFCMIPPEDSPQFFELLNTQLKQLKNTISCEVVKLEFEIEILRILGITPNLEQCVHCTEKLWISPTGAVRQIRLAGKYQLDGRQGGIRCPKCLAQHPDLAMISPGTLAYLQHRSYHRTSQNKPQLKETRQNLVELDTAFYIYLRYHLGKVPKSHKFLKIKES